MMNSSTKSSPGPHGPPCRWATIISWWNAKSFWRVATREQPMMVQYTSTLSPESHWVIDVRIMKTRTHAVPIYSNAMSCHVCNAIPGEEKRDIDSIHCQWWQTAMGMRPPTIIKKRILPSCREHKPKIRSNRMTNILIFEADYCCLFVMSLVSWF